MWNPGEIVMWRGIVNDKVWHVQPTIVVKDDPHELVLTLLPGTECLADETYPLGKQSSKRWWDFNDNDWVMKPYTWRTNRLLLILEPETYYSTILFWDHATDAFVCYYINFQLPFKRNHASMDTLDLELDIVIYPNFTYEWKDLEEYNAVLEQGIIPAEYVQEIDAAKSGIFDRLKDRKYPFDGSWLDWRPHPNWVPPRLPENWDKI
jgi:protein associated with RNAse G/E